MTFTIWHRRHCLKACIVAAAVVLLMSTAYAADFGVADVPTIVSTYRQNSVRFKRDFVGKTFSAILRFDSASEHFWGSLTAAFDGGNVICLSITGDTTKIADWNQGDHIKVDGTVYDVTLGALQLKPCALYK